MSKTKSITPMDRETANLYAEFMEASRLLNAIENHRKGLKEELVKAFGRAKVKTYKQGHGVKRARVVLLNVIDQHVGAGVGVATGKTFKIENLLIPRAGYKVEDTLARQFVATELE